MAKKKKAAVNSARGFATTSVASKPKAAKSESGTETPEVSKDASKNATENATGSASPAVDKNAVRSDDQADTTSKELHELSPEELERRLEEADLQTFVDRYSAKALRDSSRCINKLQTDCRLLRGQAPPLNTRTLLSDDLVLRLVALARDDVNLGLRFVEDTRTKPSETEDDLTARLWTLQRVLLGVGFSEAQIDAVLRYLVQFPPAHAGDALVWALEEAFDWLCCNIPEEDLPVLDAQTGRPLQGPGLPSGYHTPTADEDKAADESTEKQKKQPKPQEQSAEVNIAECSEDDNDVQMSDLDSDLEPDQLQSSYLKAKTKLFEVDPDLAPGPTKTAKNKKPVLKPPKHAKSKVSRGVQNLQQRLKRIEQDALFDQVEADLQWSNHRILLVREQSERKRMQLPHGQKEKNEDVQAVNGGHHNQPTATTHANGGNDSINDASDEEDTAIGDLFSAVPSDEQPPQTDASNVDYRNLQIRDFGVTKGVEPRRVLEEACKARDSGATISFKLVSSAAFANRHSVIITWSKDQSWQCALDLVSVEPLLTARRTTFTMKDVATPDAPQSLAYISVVALFQIFSTSSREEKAHLRLPPNWRSLWFELVEASKTQSEGKQRTNIQKLRDIVSAKSSHDESDEDVVLTKNFKKRNEANVRDARDQTVPVLITDEQQLRNIWEEKSATREYQHFLSIRSSLPMSRFRDTALETIAGSQVSIISAETGAGKSTQMPAFILEHQLSLGKPCKIYCTEPRRISAITLAQRVSEELGEQKRDLGTSRSLVGYSIRLESKTSTSTRLVYATTGIVLRMLENSEGLADITHIIIDEVHERSIETDFLLIILKSLCSKRPDLKVILMSATVDTDRFSKYFYGAPVLQVPGRTFPVKTRFLEDAIELTGHAVDDETQASNDGDDELDAEATAEQASKLPANGAQLPSYSKRTRETMAKMNHYNIDYKLITSLIENIASNPQFQDFNRAILVFLPGIAEIRRQADLLSGSWVGQRYLIHSLHSSIASEDQQAAFRLPPKGLGKIVLSTNIAETGVTIPDITCVIDTGQHKEMRFDERRQISRLLNCSVSRANAKQRRGRAGRVQEGLCFHLFTKARHDESLAEQQTPEMLRLSLQDLIMRVKICKLGDIQTTLADALDPPQPKNIRRAIDALIEVGALTHQEELTSLGHQLSKLPLDPYLGKLVIYGSFFGCLDVCLTLAATLTSKSPFVSPIGARQQADLARMGYKRGDSDLLTDFNAYTAWRRVCSTANMSEMQFCRKSFLNPQNLSNIEDLKSQLMSSLMDAGFIDLTIEDRKALGRIQNSGSRTRRFVAIPPESDVNSANTELVSSVIAWAFYPKILTREGKGWRNIATNQSINVHPTSVIRQSPSQTFNNVKFLSFYSIMQSSGTKNYNANSLTPVSGLSLLLLGGAASFQPTAHVVSVDNARIRFGIDTPRQRVWNDPNNAEEGSAVTTVGVWKTYIALKYLRRRLDEAMRRRWRKPGERFSGRLGKWMDAWSEVIAHWKAIEN